MDAEAGYDGSKPCIRAVYGRIGDLITGMNRSLGVYAEICAM